MFIIVMDGHRDQRWHSFVVKTAIRSFKGFAFVYAQKPDERMIMSRRQVEEAIRSYRDVPATQKMMEHGIRKIA